MVVVWSFRIYVTSRPLGIVPMGIVGDHRLFKPFDTTKGNAGMGIGAYDAKQYIEEIGGKLTVQSRENLGSTFTLLLPIYST